MPYLIQDVGIWYLLLQPPRNSNVGLCRNKGMMGTGKEVGTMDIHTRCVVGSSRWCSYYLRSECLQHCHLGTFWPITKVGRGCTSNPSSSPPPIPSILTSPPPLHPHLSTHPLHPHLHPSPPYLLIAHLLWHHNDASIPLHSSCQSQPNTLSIRGEVLGIFHCACKGYGIRPFFDLRPRN